jgi:hypothetical protein
MELEVEKEGEEEKEEEKEETVYTAVPHLQFQ